MRNGLSPEPLLRVRGLNAGFDAGPVLFGIELEIAPADLIALVGANGAGRSRLLGTLSGVGRATHGTSTLGGEEVTHPRPEALILRAMAYRPHAPSLLI